MQNEFGNVIFTDEDGTYWHICPEELSCEIIAADGEAFARLQTTDAFATDWATRELVERARAALGTPEAERCYCLKIPAILGGGYDLANIGTIDGRELIAFAGDVARQIKDCPDGAQVRLKITD